MNDSEELVEDYRKNVLTQDELFIHLFRAWESDFDEVVRALSDDLREHFFPWARKFCEGGGQYIAGGHVPIPPQRLSAYETWARAHGRW